LSPFCSEFDAAKRFQCCTRSTYAAVFAAQAARRRVCRKGGVAETRPAVSGAMGTSPRGGGGGFARSRRLLMGRGAAPSMPGGSRISLPPQEAAGCPRTRPQGSGGRSGSGRGRGVRGLAAALPGPSSIRSVPGGSGGRGGGAAGWARSAGGDGSGVPGRELGSCSGASSCSEGVGWSGAAAGAGGAVAGTAVAGAGPGAATAAGRAGVRAAAAGATPPAGAAVTGAAGGADPGAGLRDGSLPLAPSAKRAAWRSEKAARR